MSACDRGRQLSEAVAHELGFHVSSAHMPLLRHQGLSLTEAASSKVKAGLTAHVLSSLLGCGEMLAGSSRMAGCRRVSFFFLLPCGVLALLARLVRTHGTQRWPYTQRPVVVSEEERCRL